MSHRVPDCPSKLPEAIAQRIRECATLWKANPSRPHATDSVISAWDDLIRTWATESSLPLLVRKFRQNRGLVLGHASGRDLIPTDNSPAQWSFSLACSGIVPSLSEVHETLREDRLPIAMILQKSERESAQFRATLGKSHSLNSRGWKLAHINGIGLKTRTPLRDISIDDLRTHFVRFMSPRNMFLVPKSLAGLAEVPEFIEPFSLDGGVV